MVQIYIYFSKIPNPLHKVPHFIYAKIKGQSMVIKPMGCPFLLFFEIRN